MSALLFLVPSLVLATVLALSPRGVAAPGPRRLAGALAVALPYLAAALLLGLYGRGEAVLFHLDGYVYGLERPGGAPVTIGGSQGDDLWIDHPAYPPDAFRLRAGDGGLALFPGAGHDGHQFVQLNGQLAGLVPVGNGARLHLLPRGTAAPPAAFAVHQGGLFGRTMALRHAGGEIPVAARSGRLPLIGLRLPLAVFPPPGQRVFAVAPPGRAPAALLAFAPEAPGADLNQAGVLAMRPGVVVEGREAWPYPLAVGDGDALAFLALEEGAAPRLRTALAIADVRRFTGAVGLALADPPAIALPTLSEGERVALAGRGDLRAQDRLVRFPGISEAFADVLASLSVAGDGLQLESPYGLAEEVPFGQPIHLGGADRLSVRVTRSAAPWRPIASLLATVATVLALGGTLLRCRPGVALLGGLAVLTTARLLFGWSAAVLPPFSDESLALALFALPFVPALAIAAVALGRGFAEDPRSGLAAGSGRGFAGLHARFSNEARAAAMPRAPLPWEALAALGFAALAGLPHLVALGRGFVVAGAAPLAAAAAALLAPRVARRGPRRSLVDGIERRLEALTYRRLFALALGIYAVRAALLLFGWREGVPVGGGRLAFSILYVPGFVALLALGTARHLRLLERPAGLPVAARESGAGGVWRYALYVLGVSFLHLASGFLVSDLGLFIFLLPAALFLAALGLETWRRLPRCEGRPGLLLLAPLLLALALLAYPLGMLRLGELFLERDLGAARLAESEAVVREQNLLRLLQFLDPGRLPEIGLRDSETIAQHMAAVDAYASRGFFGDGYLRVEVQRSVATTALNDNVAAIYLLAQFGAVGGLALILGYAALLMPALGAAGDLRGVRLLTDGAVRAGGVLAALTLVGASLYVLAGNSGLLPFTGRNLYLLGLNSMGDIYEAGLLAGLVALAVGWREATAGSGEADVGPEQWAEAA